MGFFVFINMEWSNYKNSFEKYIKNIVIPKIPEIEGFKIEKEDFDTFEVWTYFHITIYLSNTNDKIEDELEDQLLSMKDYFGDNKIKILITIKSIE